MNLKIRIILLLILTIHVCKAQWTQMSNLPDSTFAFGTSFTIGNKGYALNSNCYNELWEYDSQNDTWTKKANFPAICRISTAGFSINGKGYIGLGRSITNQQETDFWEYDPATDTWTQKAQFPGVGREGAVGFSIGNKGYLGAGHTPTPQTVGTFRNDFWEYDPANDVWTQKANVPGSARANAVGISLNGKGYVGLGSSHPSAPIRDDFYEYDPLSNSWAQKQNIPASAIRDYAAIVQLNNEIYVVGGVKIVGTTPQILNTCLKYNTPSNTWSYHTNFGGSAAFGQVAFTFSNAAYVGAGVNSQNLKLSEWYKFTVNTTSIHGAELGNLTLEFYPNPTKDYLNVFGTRLNHETEFKLLSTDGRLVFQKQMNGNEEKIDLTALPQGVFIAEITSLGTTLRKKIIKE